MADVVVTIPLSFGLDQWIAEGDLPGDPWSGDEWHFYLGGKPPKIEPGERVYVVYNGKLRGYSKLVRVECYSPSSFALVRHNDSESLTIDEHIKGFRGYRYRWWDRTIEMPFPDWKTA
jgi:hypothetical protein